MGVWRWQAHQSRAGPFVECLLSSAVPGARPCIISLAQWASTWCPAHRCLQIPSLVSCLLVSFPERLGTKRCPMGGAESLPVFLASQASLI